MKHTPGPWTFEDEPKGQNIVTIKYREMPLATVRGTDDMSCIEEDEEPEIALECVANAKLISAAPELLEACKMAFDNLQKGESKTKYRLITCLNALEEAIKKATE